MQPRILPLEQLIHRGIQQNLDEVKLLIECLKVSDQVGVQASGESLQYAEFIANELRVAGSNSFATIARGGEGVPYAEIVRDTAKLLKVGDLKKSDNVVDIEEKIIKSTFERALDKMTEEERLELLANIGVPPAEFPSVAGATLAVIMSVIFKQYSSLWLLKTTPLLVNSIARSIVAQGGRALATGVLGKGLGILAGPIGWAVAGSWLAVDLSGPATRKVIPAVILLAALRQRVMKVINIAVVGDGSVGKDSLFREVFHINTDNIDPIAGATKDVEQYDYDTGKSIRLLNFPGFNDYRAEVNRQVDDIIPMTDLFICVVDANRGVTQTDIDIVDKVKALKRPMVICLNKTDMIRPTDKDKVLTEARKRLGKHTYIETVFDPDPRFQEMTPSGGDEVFEWVTQSLTEQGKDLSQLLRAREANKEEAESA